MTANHTYIGTELELFQEATNWKAYFRSRLLPYLGDEVLEVGAGLGGTTKLLCRGREKRWVCLEPDAALASRLVEAIQRGEAPACCQVVVGALADVAGPPSFDTLVYIDVLEHIEDDRGEVIRAAERLTPGGHLIALGPAHPWLYTPFDKSIGHYRRYTKKSFAALTADGLELVRLSYLDSVGLFASLGNRLVLKSSMPKQGQIAFWDKFLVPLSRIIDPVLAYSVGKSVLAVWRKQSPGPLCRGV
jgi:SAM-dependent methyltransferase